MKYKAMLLLILVCQMAAAQKDFTGEIIYKIKTPEGIRPRAKDEGENKPAEMMIRFLFAPGKIGFSDPDQKGVFSVVFLDSGFTCKIDREEKTYEIKKLKLSNARPVIATEPRLFGGFKASPVPVGNNMGPLGSVFSIGQTVFYLADSLHYFLPEKYRSNDEFILLQQGRIVLGCYITLGENALQFRDNPESESDSIPESDYTISLEAVSIKPGLLYESELQVPDGYSRMDISFLQLSPDTAVAVETIIEEEKQTLPEPPPPVKKAPSKKPAPQKPTTPKSPANSRKQ